MDELIKRISEKTGLPEDKARAAAETAVNFLKEKLPAPVAGQIDTALGSSAAASAVDKASDAIGGITGGLGGMLGGNKE